MARTVRTAMLAPERTAVGWQAHVHRRKQLKALGQVSCPEVPMLVTVPPPLARR